MDWKTPWMRTRRPIYERGLILSVQAAVFQCWEGFRAETEHRFIMISRMVKFLRDDSDIGEAFVFPPAGADREVSHDAA